MSLDTWKAEFYSTRAVETEQKDAIDHCLTKWQGLAKENLNRHQLTSRSGGISDKDGETMQMYSENCALCVHYFDEDLEDDYTDDEVSAHRACETCPLFAVRGRSCDHELDDEALSPWDSWNQKADPQPMIHWLKEAKNQFSK